MGLYDAFKDLLNVAKKADNLDLYRQLLDLSAQALELQDENTRLKEEIASLKKAKITEDRIQRHENPYLTLSDDPMKLKYCAVCWDSKQILVQMKIVEQYGSKDVRCHRCKSACHLEAKDY